MLVKLPDENSGYKDSGEGGLAFYFVVKSRYPNDRCACLAGGGIFWGYTDVVFNKNYDSHPICKLTVS